VRNALGVILVVSGYVVIYYRLLVRHFYQQQFNLPPFSASHLMADSMNLARNMRADIGSQSPCW